MQHNSNQQLSSQELGYQLKQQVLLQLAKLRGEHSARGSRVDPFTNRGYQQRIDNLETNRQKELERIKDEMAIRKNLGAIALKEVTLKEQLAVAEQLIAGGNAQPLVEELKVDVTHYE